MASGDGWLGRVRPPAATLGAAEARALDAAATRWGNGTIELTGRGNLQCRGFSPDSFPRFLDAICDAGLADPDAVADGRRRVIAAPLLADDALLARLDAALAREPALDRLGAKFAIRVDGGAVPIDSLAADLAIDADSLTLGGMRAATPDPVGAAIACCRALAARGATRADEIAAPAAFLAARGLDATPAIPAAAPATIGTHAWGVGLAPRFGQLGPGDLASLAALAEVTGDGTLRITPFRSVLLPGAPAGTLARAAALGFVVRADDPGLRIRACIGAPGCLAGEAPARAVAADFVALVPPAGILHLSGCAKGCAHPKPAARTFIGRNGVLREWMQDGAAAP